uniref:Uncharacterized protein n=1 Tax=Oryza glumipatula TaxID=40148 RepID=A0A0E0AGN4_9ORYZ
MVAAVARRHWSRGRRCRHRIRLLPTAVCLPPTPSNEAEGGRGKLCCGSRVHEPHARATYSPERWLKKRSLSHPSPHLKNIRRCHAMTHDGVAGSSQQGNAPHRAQHAKGIIFTRVT